MAYLLDMSTLAQVLRKAPSPALVRRLSQVPSRERFTSVITVSQLLLAARLDRSARLMQEVVRLVAAIRVAPYDLAAAQVFAKLRAVTPYTPIDDVMNAAIAMSRDLVLVTRHQQSYAAFEGLRVECWFG